MYLPLAFSMPGGMEMVILLVIVLVIFGGGKLAGVGKSLGEGISEFKNAVKGSENKPANEDVTPPTSNT
jgi:sec-independent protein translocase protein TatA